MAIEKLLIYFETKASFEAALASHTILDTSIVFIQETKEIYTHGTLYPCPYTKEEIDAIGNDLYIFDLSLYTAVTQELYDGLEQAILANKRICFTIKDIAKGMVFAVVFTEINSKLSEIYLITDGKKYTIKAGSILTYRDIYQATEEGKGLSTNDYSEEDRLKLSRIPKVIPNGGLTAIPHSNIFNIELRLISLETGVTGTEYITIPLATDATAGLISPDEKATIAKVVKPLNYAGSAATYDDLPTNAKVGDIYNVVKTSVSYAWTGTEWAPFGSSAIDVVNDLTTGGATVALSAEQGKTLKASVDAKQDILTDGTTIKTINGTPILGSGNIVIDTPAMAEPLFNAYITAEAVKIGKDATASNTSMAVGKEAKSSTISTSVGYGAVSTTRSMSLGTAADSSTDSLSIGTRAFSKDKSISIGTDTFTSEAAIAIGNYAAGVKDGIAIGNEAMAGTLNEIAIGNFPTRVYDKTPAENTHLAIAASDSSSSAKKNCFEIKKDNSVYIWNKDNTALIKLQDNLGLPLSGGEVNGNVSVGYSNSNKFTHTDPDTAVVSKGEMAFAQGNACVAASTFVCAQGMRSIALGLASHSEGSETIASGMYSHAEGSGTKAFGMSSHSEGNNTQATADFSHAEGLDTKTVEQFAHAEGQTTTAEGQASHSEGLDTIARGDHSHAEGYETIAEGNKSHAEGNNTEALGIYSHAEGQYTKALKDYSHAEGSYGEANEIAAHAEGYNTRADGSYSHSEGYTTKAIEIGSHAEGNTTGAYGPFSHAEGGVTKSIGSRSHAEGYSTIAEGTYAHSEGSDTTAKGQSAHAEGSNNIAEGNFSHAEGVDTLSKDVGSHAEGYGVTANGNYSHAEGNETVTNNHGEHASGIYNKSTAGASKLLADLLKDKTATLCSVGYGTSATDRKNALEIKYTGETFIDKALSVAGFQVTGNEIGDFKISAQTRQRNGWLACNGTSYSKTTYATLYALLGDGSSSPTDNTMFTIDPPIPVSGKAIYFVFSGVL